MTVKEGRGEDEKTNKQKYKIELQSGGKEWKGVELKDEVARERNVVTIQREELSAISSLRNLH